MEEKWETSKEGEKMKASEKSPKKIFDLSHMKKENFVVILLIGVLLLVVAWPVGGNTKKEETQSELTDSQDDMIKKNEEMVSSFEEMAEIKDWKDYISYLEQTLEELLSTMEGAGKVKVMITLKDSGETVVEKDITTETGGTTQVDTQGSNNTSDRYEIGETVFESVEKGISSPYVKQVISPQIEGVVVSTQGGDNLQVNKNITEAIQALFGIDVHKIKIIKMSSKS